MSAIRTTVLVGWLVFGAYWFIAAFFSKRGSRSRPPGLLIVILFVILRTIGPDTLAVHALAVQIVGLVLFLAGLGLAVWARIYLGRNWGMPMTRKDEPELVTSGPYRFVRHPIYSGLFPGHPGHDPGHQPVLADRVGCAWGLFRLQREGRRATDDGVVPGRVPRVPSQNEDADSVPALDARARGLA